MPYSCLHFIFINNYNIRSVNMTLKTASCGAPRALCPRIRGKHRVLLTSWTHVHLTRLQPHHRPLHRPGPHLHQVQVQNVSKIFILKKKILKGVTYTNHMYMSEHHMQIHTSVCFQRWQLLARRLVLCRSCWSLAWRRTSREDEWL